MRLNPDRRTSNEDGCADVLEALDAWWICLFFCAEKKRIFVWRAELRDLTIFTLSCAIKGTSGVKMDTSDTMNLQFSPRFALTGADKTDRGAARQTDREGGGREGGGRRGSVKGGQVAGLFIFFFFFFILRLSDLDSEAAARHSWSLLR